MADQQDTKSLWMLIRIISLPLIHGAHISSLVSGGQCRSLDAVEDVETGVHFRSCQHRIWSSWITWRAAKWKLSSTANTEFNGDPSSGDFKVLMWVLFGKLHKLSLIYIHVFFINTHIICKYLLLNAFFSFVVFTLVYEMHFLINTCRMWSDVEVTVVFLCLKVFVCLASHVPGRRRCWFWVSFTKWAHVTPWPGPCIFQSI